MKSYFYYVDEITEDILYKGLLAYGMFSEKIVPIFSSENFYDYCVKTPKINLRKNGYGYISYDAMRNVGIPRHLGIPHPIAYLNLCNVLKEYWKCKNEDGLKKHFEVNTKDEKHKVSRIHIRVLENKKILFSMTYEDDIKEDITDITCPLLPLNGNYRITDRDPSDKLKIGSLYLVKADISTCFSSIYTHSIPWALIGKAKAKEDRKDDKWYNKIDKSCQMLKCGETHGLLIGPHASNLISEIILTVVDKELVTRGWNYIRNIDDYSCYVDSQENAEKFITELSKELKKFDLTLNYKKTKIGKLPIPESSEWVRILSSFNLISNYGQTTYKEVQAFFSVAIDLFNKNDSNASVYKYAIKRLSKSYTCKNSSFSENAKEYFIDECFYLSSIYTYLLPLIEEYVFAHFDVTEDRIKEFSIMIYKKNKLHNNYEAMCYSIYFALKHKFELPCINADEILETDSCILKTLGMLYFKMNKEEKELKKFKKNSKELMGNAKDFDENWIYSYETLSAEALKGELKALKEAGVSFLKSEFIYPNIK